MGPTTGAAAPKPPPRTGPAAAASLSSPYRVRDATTGAILADRLRPAHTHWTRLKGLLGTRSLEPGEGLWLKPCNQVHTIGMRYPIDVAFIDDDYHVVRTVSDLRPNGISPRVVGATSVLELPAGTIASVGLREGARLEIDGEPSIEHADWLDVVGAWMCNCAIAAFYAFFATAHFAAALRSGQWGSTLPIVAQEALVVVLFLTRRRSRATSPRPLDWAVGITGTLLPTLLRPAEAVGVLNWLGEPTQIVGLTLATAGLAFLGRSIAVVAANRGVKTYGMYRVVRHPMYAAYIVTYVGYVASYPTLRNCVITAATIAMLNARALAEERFLQRDSVYEEYLDRVRWRFVPYVY